MIEYLCFKDFFGKGNDAEFLECTKNQIILCENFETQWKLRKVFDKLIKEDVETDNTLLFKCSTKDEPLNFKLEMTFAPTSIYSNNDQHFILTVEAIAILSMKNIYDLYFLSQKKTCALNEFKGSGKDWEKGVMEVYRKYIRGIYGCYTGEYLKI